tara:strand:+ start:4121 stop:5707 length:1587 start_codon:yes stop_codon:yes gene_type:complete
MGIEDVDNGQEQSGLPTSWSLVNLPEIAEVNPTLDKQGIDENLQVSFVPMPAVEAETGHIDVSASRKFSEVKKGYTAFLEGDVLFAKITPCMENGKMAVVPALQNGVGFGSTEFHVLRACADISPQYLYYFVSSKQFRMIAERNMTGAVGQRRVPTSYINESQIPLPPTHEQQRIVTKIEELFSELDKGVEILRTAQQQLKIYRQALLKHAFEGKLTADWRAQNPDKLESADALLARIQQEREAHYQQSLQDWQAAQKDWETNGKAGSKLSKPKAPKALPPLTAEELAELPELPFGWAWGRLGYMTCGVEYGTAAKSSTVGRVAVLRMGNIQNSRINWEELVYTDDLNEIAKYSLRHNDVLFNRTNSPELVGKSAIYKSEQPALFAGYLIRVNQVSSIAHAQFLNLFLGSHVAKQHGNRVKTDGVNQSNINGDKLVNYPFPFCHQLEQEAVITVLEGKLSLLDQLEQTITHSLQQAEALRQSILKKAFSGQLVPQDPSDEPASVLLERIRAERAAQPKARGRKIKVSA